MTVFVVDRKKHALMPCSEKRARMCVAIRASGSFNIQTAVSKTRNGLVQGILHRFCTLIQRAYGYGYSWTHIAQTQGNAGKGAVINRRAIPPRPKGRGFPRNWMKKTVLALLVFPAIACADALVDMRTAIISALANPPGHTYTSNVTIGGIGFSQLSAQSGSDAPFQFDITKILDYPKPGCGKLKLSITQPGGFGEKDFNITSYMSICSDGSPYSKPDLTLPKN